jgi:hypothetical protein
MIIIKNKEYTRISTHPTVDGGLVVEPRNTVIAAEVRDPGALSHGDGGDEGSAVLVVVQHEQAAAADALAAGAEPTL